MGMHCLKCGGQLTSDAKEPLCGWCKKDIAKEEISKSPTWALKIALEEIASTLDDLKTEMNTIRVVQREIIEAIKQKP